jgi:hypothetical protein
MAGMRPRGLLPVVAAVLLCALWLIFAVWQSPHRADLSGFGGYAVTLAVATVSLCGWIWHTWTRRAAQIPSVSELSQLSASLARAATEQWTRVAGEQGLLEPPPILVRWGRPGATLAGPRTNTLASRRFLPAPGLAAVSRQQLEEGQIQDLHALYGGLGSGRLVIAGPSGSGKTGAAILLALTALAHMAQLPEESGSSKLTGIG